MCLRLRGSLITAHAILLTSCPQPSPHPPPQPPDAADAAIFVDAGPIGDSGDDALVDAGPIDAAPVDAGPITSNCIAACTALANVGCSMGRKGDCGMFLTRILSSGHVSDSTNHPVTCDTVRAVRTKAAAVALGFVCP